MLSENEGLVLDEEVLCENFLKLSNTVFFHRAHSSSVFNVGTTLSAFSIIAFIIGGGFIEYRTTKLRSSSVITLLK